MFEQIDHYAYGVEDIEEQIAFYRDRLGMTLGRRGTHRATGGKIAFMWDTRTGFKIELVETPQDARELGFMHVAYRVADVGAALASLEAAGCERLGGPHRIEAAEAETGRVRDATGLEIQVIKYDPGSPDV